MCVILLNVCDQGKNTVKTKVALNFFSLILKVIVGLPWSVCMCVLSCVRLFATLWAHQAPLFMGFSRQEYWSRLPFPPPRDLPDPGIEP